ncbi:MAG: glyceraldehyde 3-phosphate dehydrogenase [Oleiphilaceae bacterium]|jgi:glyceraldehyde 3-phosphate dehydrogenase
MTIRIAINGFGRIGRLALRAAWDSPDFRSALTKNAEEVFEFVHINEVAGNSETAAHLLKYDSVHGTWEHDVSAQDSSLVINDKVMSFSSNRNIDETPWKDLNIDILIDCTGQFKSKEKLQEYLKQGIKKVVVSAPVKDGTLNIVMGVNDHLYNETEHDIVTAASCTTNCIAPVVAVIQKEFGIKHGTITTIHDITNTQSILDEYHSDLRRARACGQSLIPTSTGSATAIAEIFPELKGRINGMAVRVPLANASLTDCVFELEQSVTKKQVNQALKSASENELINILGYEEKPLVSVDYTNDKRSAIIDALSTMVIHNTQLKLFVWYDNEIGYVNRMIELVCLVGNSIKK